MQRYILICVFICLAICTRAQSAVIKTAQGVRFCTENKLVEVSFYTPTIVRILKSPLNVEYTKNSLSVIAEPQTIKYKMVQSGDELKLNSDKLVITINIKSGQINYFTNRNELLLEEKASRFVDFDDAGTKSFSVYQSFALDENEAIYGLGQLQTGKMSQRNQVKQMVQGNTEDFIPFIQSVKGYGLFWDNYSPTTFTDNKTETSFLSEVGDCIDYYFMYGETADGVISEMRHLTGDVPMFPLWTYGFWQSKERYKSQAELVGVVDKYRKLEVPIDGIIQDWQYWGNNYLWNAMDFLNSEYADPQKMINDVHKLNAHMIISIWSSFGPHTHPYRELDSLGLLFHFQTWPQSGLDVWPPDMSYPSGVRVYDAYSPLARDIYWKYLNKGIYSLGMDGWWMDSTEPDHLDFKSTDFDEKTEMGSFRRVRNAYPLMTVGGVYEHQRAIGSDKRIFILTRSAFAGQQRYGSNVWSGDVQASWETLKRQIPAGLNFSSCAIPHWNTDIGGFFLSNYPKKLNDPQYCELYVRWLQFGAFCPMMRSHGTNAPREIYQFGQKGEPIYDAIEKYIRLRYSLLPYIYTTAWEVSSERSTFMRALYMDFADDKSVWDINDEYMFGKSLLISPVTDPLSDISFKSVYLPKGKWYDYWTNEVKEGGCKIDKEVSIDIMPIYVKAGSIIPIGPDVQYATEKKWDDLEIRIYPGDNGSFTLYEDEFDNYNYEKGAYNQIQMNWNDATRVLTIGKSEGEYSGKLKCRVFHINCIKGKSVDVVYDGKCIRMKL